MFYNKVFGTEISGLGFGTMRLPLRDGKIDEAQTFEMVDYALNSGVNYFDTAYPYHGGYSEIVVGKALARHDRKSFMLADKFPGHQISSSYNAKEVFEEQLRKCKVDYFDFYLLHNVYEQSLGVYTGKWGIVEYLIEQKRNGRIKHLGFSSHGSLDVIKKILDYGKGELEFCQIQLNYLDWTMQDAKAKYEYLTDCGIPVIVMEPVRGGRLAKLDETSEAELHALSEGSIASFALRWLHGLGNVATVLSGMSDLAQMKDNIATFDKRNCLNEAEQAAIERAVRRMVNSVPCTKCRYCTDGCPAKLDIPELIAIYNEIKFAPVVNTSMRLEFAPKETLPSACLKCGKCAKMCPQSISIPAILEELTSMLDKMPRWADISKQREEESKKLRQNPTF